MCVIKCIKRLHTCGRLRPAAIGEFAVGAPDNPPPTWEMKGWGSGSLALGAWIQGSGAEAVGDPGAVLEL